MRPIEEMRAAAQQLINVIDDRDCDAMIIGSFMGGMRRAMDNVIKDWEAHK